MMQTLKQTMMVVVESLMNKFEEDQLKKEEMHRKSQHEQSSSHYTDNCSDSDSSFNQVHNPTCSMSEFLSLNIYCSIRSQTFYTTVEDSYY